MGKLYEFQIVICKELLDIALLNFWDRKCSRMQLQNEATEEGNNQIATF
jgi:hypothetical protein